MNKQPSFPSSTLTFCKLDFSRRFLTDSQNIIKFILKNAINSAWFNNQYRNYIRMYMWTGSDSCHGFSKLSAKIIKFLFVFKIRHDKQRMVALNRVLLNHPPTPQLIPIMTKMRSLLFWHCMLEMHSLRFLLLRDTHHHAAPFLIDPNHRRFAHLRPTVTIIAFHHFPQCAVHQQSHS